MPTVFGTPSWSIGGSEFIICWHPCAVAYILCLQPGLDLQEHLLQKEAALKKVGCTLQPHVVVVCEDINNMDNLNISIAYTVIQSNVYYELPTVVPAVLKCALWWIWTMQSGQSCHWSTCKKDYDIHTRHDDAGSKVLQLQLTLLSDMMTLVLVWHCCDAEWHCGPKNGTIFIIAITLSTLNQFS